MNLMLSVAIAVFDDVSASLTQFFVPVLVTNFIPPQFRLLVEIVAPVWAKERLS